MSLPKIVGQGPEISEVLLSANDSTAKFPLGTRVTDVYGDEFIYVSNGEASTALSRGKVVMPEAAVDTDTWSSDTDKLVLTDTGAMTAGAYAGWLAYVNDGTGEGQLRRIKTNSVYTLTLEEALTTSLSVSDSDLLIFQPYLVNLATASTQVPPIGVAVGAITAAYYGWVQTSGIAEVLGGGALVAGKYVKLADDTAGQVLVAADGNDLYDITVIGIALQANTNADKGVPVLLNLR